MRDPMEPPELFDDEVTEEDDFHANAEAPGKEVKVGDAELENARRVKEETLLNQDEGSSPNFLDGDDSGTDEEQSAFMKMLERFHKERSLEFKPPKFYGEGVNCLKLWRAVARLGGYEQVTSSKFWRQVGRSFQPPKTCTTVSWAFRNFYEKALLEYERHKIHTGELQVPISSICKTMVADKKRGEKKREREGRSPSSDSRGFRPNSSCTEMGGNQVSGSGRAKRDAAARFMQGWHSRKLLSNGEVGDLITRDKKSVSLFKTDKHLTSIGGSKRKNASLERAAKVPHTKLVKPQDNSMVVDLGKPADWVKINVRQTKDCYEVYALVPGLLQEELHVQSEASGVVIISGEPQQLDNPWGIGPFKKVVNLPSRIDQHQTSAVVTLHGKLFVRVPFEQSDL